MLTKMEPRKIRIADRLIGSGEKPLVIAEMSGNHNRSLEQALAIVDAAADAGADAIKLQTYTADTLTMDVDGPGFRIDNAASLWKGRTLYELYDEAHTPWDWHETIFARAKQRGIIAFSSPFDDTAVEFLESLDVPAYKIASFELTHLPLIRRVAATGKPMIMSTGMATLGEIEIAVEQARRAGATDIVLLKCTSTYPASPKASDLRTIPHLRQSFGVPVGLSDHTLGIGVAIASVAVGACVVEKHLTLDRSEGGVDAAFSLEPAELKSLVTELQRGWQALGEVSYGPTGDQKASLDFRQSI